MLAKVIAWYMKKLVLTLQVHYTPPQQSFYAREMEFGGV